MTLVVVSAIDKTTNKLEEIWKSYQNNDVDSAIYKTNKCIDFHYKIINLLLNKNKDFVSQFDSLSNELKFFISGNKKDNDLSYSKIVSYGELWSTVIISHYLNSQGIKNKWVDARELIQTETAHVESKINWSSTNELIQEKLSKNQNFIISQGFIGANNRGETITLGREGSDFSAAIYAHCLNVKNVTIWKDVDGLLNADPKWFKKHQDIENISYKEAIELSYLGASVIHPKTIKPLQNKKLNCI